MCRVGSLLVWLVGTRLGQVLSRGFVVCVFTYHFGMLVVGCVCNPFFLSLANQGAYFNSVLNIRFKAPLRYALVVCLHFIPPNHEQMKRFYRQIRKILAVVRYRYRDLEERERKEKDINIFCLVEFYRKERRKRDERF